MAKHTNAKNVVLPSTQTEIVDLRDLLFRVVASKTTSLSVLARSSGNMGTMCFHANRLATAIVQVTTLARRGKDAKPLKEYDPDVQLVLNKRGFFSASVGYYFDRQRQTVIEQLLLGKSATLLCTNDYGLSGKTHTPVHVWTITFRFVNKRLIVTTIFGVCEVFPMLLYEIAAIEAVSHWFKQQIKAADVEFAWYFHELIGNGDVTNLAYDVEKDVVLTTVPVNPAEVVETLNMEAYIRENTPTICPIPRIPLPEQLIAITQAIHSKWRPTRDNKESAS